MIDGLGGAPLILVTGGARSGKSSYAQQIAESLEKGVLFVATAEALDDEMRLRVQRHRETRPQEWLTREEPLYPSRALHDLPEGISVVILDCLTLLVTNQMLREPDASYERLEKDLIHELERFLEGTRVLNLTTLVVTNEVGMGIVPDNPLARNFRDLAGRANQMVANRSDQVFLMVAGIPLQLKSSREGSQP